MPQEFTIRSKPYDNIAILAMDGVLLGFCGKRKSNWYLKRGLAVEDRYGDCNAIKLQFEPQGRYGQVMAAVIGPRKNQCVVCGSEENLTRHHVVPYCFRRYMKEWNHHNSFDVVILCEKHHQAYEKKANRMKDGLMRQSKIPNHMYMSAEESDVYKTYRKAVAVSKYMKHMPEETRIRLVIEVCTFFGYPVDETTVNLVANLDMERNKNHNAYQSIVDDLDGNVRDFIKMWASHFFKLMKPKFMPNCGQDLKTFLVSIDGILTTRENQGL